MFQVQSISPVIDAGVTVSGFAIDYEGTTRPQGSAWDTGAYEFVSGAPPSPPPPPDITAPVVSLTSPVPASTVSSTVTVTATATDDTAVAGVQFKLDGINLSTEDTTSPYSVTWDTTTATDAVHTLDAVARDTAGNLATSTISLTVDNVMTPPPDITPPVISAVTVSNITTTSAIIQWTTDEPSTTQVDYGLDTTYGESSTLNSTLVTSHTVILTTLGGGTTYNYRVRSSDTANNEAISINYQFTTDTPIIPDTTAPSAVTDLTPTNITETSVDLVTWSAPGDDGNTGTASSYDLRYSLETIIDLLTFNLATLATGLPTPSIAGTLESYTLVGLTPNTTYTTALTTQDEVPNVSDLSNIITFTTLATPTPPPPPPSPSPSPSPTPSPTPPPPSGGGGGGGGGILITDRTPPPIATEVTAKGAENQVLLTWTNPTVFDYVRTRVVRNTTPPQSPIDGTIIYEGRGQEFTDTDLDNSITYHYAIYTLDRVPNYSLPQRYSISPEGGATSFTIDEPETCIPLEPTPASGGLPLTGQAPAFTRNLTLGSRGNDVKELQIFLNSNGFGVSTTGAGSPGNETTYFGNKTRQALVKIKPAQNCICSACVRSINPS